jgi:hypothetical protein
VVRRGFSDVIEGTRDMKIDPLEERQHVSAGVPAWQEIAEDWLAAKRVGRHAAGSASMSTWSYKSA